MGSRSVTVCSSTRRAFLLLLERGSEPLHLAFEGADPGIAAVDLHHLLGGSVGRLLHLPLEAVDGERELRPQAVFVGRDLLRGQRHGRP